MKSNQRELLASIVGNDTMKQICDILGGEVIYIPVAYKPTDRDTRLAQDFIQLRQNKNTCMMSYADLANQYDLSVRRVQEIVSSQLKTQARKVVD